MGELIGAERGMDVILGTAERRGRGASSVAPPLAGSAGLAFSSRRALLSPPFRVATPILGSRLVAQLKVISALTGRESDGARFLIESHPPPSFPHPLPSDHCEGGPVRVLRRFVSAYRPCRQHLRGLMAVPQALRLVVPQIDVTRAVTTSQAVAGEKAFFGARSGKQLSAAVTREKGCRVAAIGNVRATATSEVVKEKAKSGEKAEKSQLLVTREEGLELYEDMVLGRSFEDMCAQMYYRGKMFGFVHLYNGQEAVSTGFIKLLKKEDYVTSTYRDHVHALSKGVPARQVMSELFGKTTGCCRGQGGSMHMFSAEHGLLGGFAFIGEGIPVAVGAAFSSKYKREVMKDDKADAVSIAFFGDGTANNGQFFECLNMAQLWKLPVIFVVENNLWAIGMSHYRSTSEVEIWKKGPAFGMASAHVDGMDVLKVREVAKEAVARARRGDGPTLIECETYRFRGHSLADPDELRSPAEKAHYAARDPIVALKKYLLENELVTEADLKSIEKKIDDVVEDAVDFADASPLPERSQLLENVFADPKGFGIGPDGRYRCEDPGFTAGTAQV